VSISGAFRVGDIRHNLADLKQIRAAIGYEPKWNFREGLSGFLEWTSHQPINASAYDRSLTEMRDRGLMHG
jgi:dTDP-L-rhamnose 4-epimerase